MKDALIVESKEDIRKFTDWIIKRLVQVENLSTENASEVARNLTDRFLSMKSRLKSPYNDLYYWIKLDDVEELENYLNNLDAHIKSKEDTKQKAKDGARLVYSDDTWKVYEITTYEASVKYGKNTKWCITGSKRWADNGDGRDFWDNYYSKDGVKFYFFIKSNDEKYALAVYPGDRYCEIYNNEDVSIPFIPDAPIIDEIKVNYSDDSPGNILVDAIMTKKLPENILFTIFENVIYDNTGENITIYDSAKESQDFLADVENMIPDGFVEHAAVENGDLTAEEYEKLVGEPYEEYWGGDICPIAELFAYTGNTKEEVLKTIESNIAGHKYLVLEESYDGYYLDFIKDWVELFQLLNSKSGVQDWSELDIDEFFEDTDFGGSRASVFATMCANQLVWDIRNGRFSTDVVSNLGLPKDYFSKVNESFDNLLSEDEKVSENVYFHGSSDDISGELNHAINWITKDFEYAKYYAVATSEVGYVYECSATLGNLFDIGRTGFRVYDLLPIKPYRLSREFTSIVRKLDLTEEQVNKLLENVIYELNLENNGYSMMTSSVARTSAFKRVLESKGYDGIKAIEYNKRTSKYVDTYGLFNAVKIIGKQEVRFNESLREEYEDFEITEEDLEDYLESDTKYSKKLSKPNADGAMLLLSNGDIYDISSYEVHSMFAGAFAGHLGYDASDFDNFDSDALDYLEDELGVITLNPGSSEFEDRLKIVSSVRPTNAQFEVIREFIDEMQSKFDANTPLYIWMGSHSNDYKLGDYTSDEFVKKFKLSFVRDRLEEEKAITFGDLDYGKKAETTRVMTGGRGTGHFGTGFYFVGENGKYGLDDKGNLKYDYAPNRPVYEIDLDSYKLFRPKDNDTGYKVHDALKEINDGYEPSLEEWLNKDFNTEKIEDELFQIGWDAQSVYEDLEDDEDLDFDFDDLEDLLDDSEDDAKEVKNDEPEDELDRKYEELYRKKVKDFIAKYGLERYVWKDIDTEKLGVIENHVKDAIHSKYSSIAGLRYALKVLSRELNVSQDKLLDAIRKAYNNKDSQDTISTQLLKALGYEGVDVTHLNHDAQGLSGLDNFSYGTVIYDLKPGTYKRIKEPREKREDIEEDLSKEQEEYFKDSKIRDSQGNLLVCYHGTENPGFNEFDARKGKSQFGDYKFDDYNINYFTTNKETAVGYTDLGYEHDNNVYACYLNVVNPYVVNNKTKDDMYRTWQNIKDETIRDKEILYFERFYDKWTSRDVSEKDLDELNKDMFFFNCKFISNEDDHDYYDLVTLGNNTMFGSQHPLMYAYELSEYFDKDNFEEFRNSLVGDYEGEDKEYFSYTIDNLIRWVLLMNKEDNTNYDGIIIPDISDVGPKGSVFLTGKTTDIVTLKSSNQIKRVDNKNPTKSLRIDEELKEILYDKPVNGPSFITPEGKFVRVPGDTHTSIFDVDKYKDRKRSLKDFCNETGYIRVNDGTILGWEQYITLTQKEPTQKQYEALTAYLDYLLFVRDSDGVSVDYLDDSNQYQYYEWDDVLVDEIIDRIKDLYKTGKLREEVISAKSFDMFATDSAYDVKHYLMNHANEPWRVFIDEHIPLYLVGRPYECTHSDMVDLANKNGYDTYIDDFDKKKVCIVYTPFDEYANPEITEQDASEDDYEYAYQFDNDKDIRFNVYSRYIPFSGFELYRVLSNVARPMRWKIHESEEFRKMAPITYFMPESNKRLFKRYLPNYHVEEVNVADIVKKNNLLDDKSILDRRADKWGNSFDDYHIKTNILDLDVSSPIRLDSNYRILDGHHRFIALYNDGWKTAEVLVKNKDTVKEESLNESKQDIEKFRQWAGDELADRFFKLKDRLPDRTKDIYFWMGNEKQLLNLKDRYKGAQEMSDISNYEQWAHENSLNGLRLALDNVEQTPTRREINKLGKEGSEKIYEDDNWLVLKINTYEASVKYGKGTEWCITGNNSDQGRVDFNHHTIDSNATIYFFINKKNKLHKYALEYVNDNDWCLFDETDFPHVGYGNSFKRGVDSMGGEHWYKGDARDIFPVIKELPDINKAYDDFENMNESLKESINKYYRLEIEDSFGDREGLWTGAFNLIPTKETIENYSEDFEELTPDERRNYYQFDYLLNKLSKIKSPGVDTNFNGFRERDIFAFTSNKYAEIKDIINEMKHVLKELGFKLIIKELDVDDVEISYRDNDQIAFHKSEVEKELEEKIVKKGNKYYRLTINGKGFFNELDKIIKRLRNGSDEAYDDASALDGLLYYFEKDLPYNSNQVKKGQWAFTETEFNRLNNIESPYTEGISIIEELEDILSYYRKSLEITEVVPNNILYQDEKQIQYESLLSEKIVKKGNKWQVQSEKGKNLGTYDTKKEAEDRLKQVHYFKHVNEDLQETDNEGNVLSKEQIEFFKNSKVRDSSGKLCVCYHATNNDFDTFDSSKWDSGEGSVWGKGFYFFDKYLPRNLKDYGSKIMKCYLNIVNPIKEEPDMFVKLLISKFGDFDASEFEKFRKRYWNDYNDEDIIEMFVKKKFNCDVDFAQLVMDAGYDGRILGDGEVVCYYPNQIKSIDNKNPTSSNNINEDLKWDYKNISKDLVSNLEDLTYWNDKSFGVDVYEDDWDSGCDIEATYSDENDTELAWLVVRVYQDRQAITFRQIDVYENGGLRGTGFAKALVERVLRALPKGTKILVHMDMSGGFWYHMSQTFKDYDWDKSLHENLKEEIGKTVIAYHGSQADNLEFRDNYPLYLTNDKELATKFAKGYNFNYDLLPEDRPTVYTMKVTLNNPYTIKDEKEYDELMDISNYEDVMSEMIKQGYDGLIYEVEDNLIYYTVFNPKNQVEVVSKENALTESVDDRDFII